MNTGSVTYKRGIVSATKPGFARVRFDDIDGLVSAWLPVTHPKTLADRIVWTLDIGEHVACLMDGQMEDGCIVGAIYSDVDAPPVASPDKFRLQFSDGGSIEYDRTTGQMRVVSIGPVHVRAPSVTIDAAQVTITGHLTVAQGIDTPADVVASGISLVGHVHGGITPGTAQTQPPA